MGSIGIGEFLLVLLAALVAVGPDRLPSVARDFARVIRTLRGVAGDVKGQLRREVGLDEVSEIFRAHGFDDVKPQLTLSGSLPHPPARPSRPAEEPAVAAPAEPQRGAEPGTADPSPRSVREV